MWGIFGCADNLGLPTMWQSWLLLTEMSTETYLFTYKFFLGWTSLYPTLVSQHFCIISSLVCQESCDWFELAGTWSNGQKYEPFVRWLTNLHQLLSLKRGEKTIWQEKSLIWVAYRSLKHTSLRNQLHNAVVKNASIRCKNRSSSQRQLIPIHVCHLPTSLLQGQEQNSDLEW